MSYVANINDNGPISPIAKIKENLSIWTVGQWSHFRIEYMEGIPWSSTATVEMVTTSGATTIGANGTISKQIINFLQLADLELLHLRFEPLDDMEGILWEQSSQGRFVSRALHARVDMLTSSRDPWLGTTTFFVLGRNRDMLLEVRNPAPVTRALARFVFWGYRYVLYPWKDDKEKGTSIIKGIEEGRIPSTWLPAEGMSV